MTTAGRICQYDFLSRVGDTARRYAIASVHANSSWAAVFPATLIRAERKNASPSRSVNATSISSVSPGRTICRNLTVLIRVATGTRPAGNDGPARYDQL